MTGNVIHFGDEVLKRFGVGFLLCPKCQEQSCFLPIVKKRKGRLYLSSLQCCGPYCIDDIDRGVFIKINDGYVSEVLS